MALKVTVEQRHIDAGMRHNGHSCPVALAIREKYGFGYVFVGRRYVELGQDELETQFAGHTQAMMEFIDRFDEGQSVRPHTFIIRGIHP